MNEGADVKAAAARISGGQDLEGDEGKQEVTGILKCSVPTEE
jgi:hypothetical protein